MDYATFLTIVLALMFSMCAVSTINTFTRSPFPADVTPSPSDADPNDDTPNMYSYEDPMAPKLMMLLATLATGAAATLTYRRASVPTIAAALGVAGVSAAGMTMM